MIVRGAAPASGGIGGCAKATDEPRSVIPQSSRDFMTVSLPCTGCKETASPGLRAGGDAGRPLLARDAHLRLPIVDVDVHVVQRLHERVELGAVHLREVPVD